MRASIVAILIAVHGVGTSVASAAEPTARYDVKPDLKAFPQSTPKETLGSILKAIEAKRFDYLLAQLAEASWVDQRVKQYGGKLSPLVDETRGHLSGLALKRLQRFQKEGEWETSDDNAIATVKKLTDRVVRMKKIDDRWYLVNDNKPSED